MKCKIKGSPNSWKLKFTVISTENDCKFQLFLAFFFWSQTFYLIVHLNMYLFYSFQISLHCLYTQIQFSFFAPLLDHFKDCHVTNHSLERTGEYQLFTFLPSNLWFNKLTSLREIWILLFLPVLLGLHLWALWRGQLTVWQRGQGAHGAPAGKNVPLPASGSAAVSKPNWSENILRLSAGSTCVCCVSGHAHSQP